jgi:hypothetical protein
VSLTTVGVLPLLTLAAPTFGIYASLSAQLTAEVAALLELDATLSIDFPEILVVIDEAVEMVIALDLAADIGVPSLNVSFAASLSLSLALLLALVATLEAAVAVGGAGIAAVSYSGQGATCGGALEAVIADGWSDGTPPTQDVFAVILGATGDASNSFGTFFDGVLFSGGAVPLGTIGLEGLATSDFALLVDLLGEMKARASASVSAQASVQFLPPSCAASATFVAKALANLRAAAAIGMPKIGASVLATISARIRLIGSLVAQITAALSLATDGFDVFVYQGPGSGLGPALTSRLSGGWPDGSPPTAQSSVLVLGCTTPEAQAAVSTFFPPVAA